MALQDLSRDHHRLLIEAQRLRRIADGPDLASPALGFATFAKESLWPHCEDEELLLVPRLEPRLARAMQADHDWLRSEVAALEVHAREGRPLADVLRRLGERLHRHVRFEEDQCFEALQRSLGPDGLETLHAGLDARRKGRGLSCSRA